MAFRNDSLLCSSQFSPAVEQHPERNGQTDPTIIPGRFAGWWSTESAGNLNFQQYSQAHRSYGPSIMA